VLQPGALNLRVDGGRIGRVRVLRVDQRTAAEIDTQWDAVPERHGKQSCHAEDEREGQEVPLFPEEIDVCISKKFHAAYDPFKISRWSLVDGRWSFAVRRSFQLPQTTIDYRRTTALNAQCLSTLLPAQHPIKNHARYKYCGEQVGEQTEYQCRSETLYRPCTEEEQNRRRNDGGDVSIDDRDPGVAESLLHRRRRGLAISQLFPDALKNQDVRVHAHTNGQDDAGNPRQRQHRSDVPHETEQDDQVQDERDIGIHARPAVVNQHENEDDHHANDRRSNAGTNRIGPQRWTNRALFQILDSGRQSAGT